jgi:hypothetical protein
MFEYFYHEILRKTIIGFGTLFNNITVKHFDESGNISSVIKVPLAYGPIQKFLARVEQQPDLNSPVQITLPRMSFEFNGLNYDQTRKLTTTQTFVSLDKNSNNVRKSYMPVPYNMEFDLNIMCKLNDDMLQIVEQILPYFQPGYNLTIDLVDAIGEKRDIPIVLSSILMDDDYEGDYSKRRALTYTLKFVAKTYLFGPIETSSEKDIIKKVSVGFVAGDTNSTTRDLRYTSEPKATKNYSDNVVASLTENVSIGDIKITVSDSTSISINSYITINEETLNVVEKNGKVLTVRRGSYGTPIKNHVSGSDVKLITTQDNDLIEFGDEFGFIGSFGG